MTSQITTDKVVRSIPQVFAILILLVQFAGYFVKGASPGSDWIRITISLAYPFALIVSAIVTVRQYFTFAMRKEQLFNSAMFFIALLWTVGTGLILGNKSDLYQATYDIFNLHGILAMMILSGFALYYLMLVELRPTKPSDALIMAVLILALMVVTPVGDIISPAITNFGVLVYLYPGAVGAQVFNLVIYIGILVLVVRALLFKERLRS